MLRIIASGVLLVCMHTLSTGALAVDSLHARLGGKPVITRVVHGTVDSIAGDPRVNQSFDQIDLRRLKEKLVEQLCALTGGGCTYTGDEMKQVHQGLEITEGEFYALVEALRKALNDQGVGEREKNELLSILAPMKNLVVEK